MKLNEMPKDDYSQGYKEGAYALANGLLQSIQEGESEGIPFNSNDYKKAIVHLRDQLAEASEPQMVVG